MNQLAVRMLVACSTDRIGAAGVELVGPGSEQFVSSFISALFFCVGLVAGGTERANAGQKDKGGVANGKETVYGDKSTSWVWNAERGRFRLH